MRKGFRKRWKRVPSLFLIILILLSVILSNTGDLKASDELSGYCFQVVGNEDHTGADIIGDSTHMNDGAEIIEILDSDGVSMDLENISYHVVQNDVYTFQVFFRSPTGEHTENIPVSVNTIIVPETNAEQAEENPAPDIYMDQTDENPVPDKSAGQAGEKPDSDMKTVGELREAGRLKEKTVTFPIPMYIEGENTSQGDYPFSGGDIVNIEDRTFNGLPYKFHHAQILITEDGDAKTYPINYYDEINGIKYYALSDQGENTSQDYEVAYEVPEGAGVSFIYSLNTQSYPVTVNNPKETEGFEINYITGITTDSEGSLVSKYNTQVKLVLTYPAGYYTENAPAGQQNVGIEFSDSSLMVTKVTDREKRSISYTFVYPDKPLTLEIVGDEETTGLMYGVYDASSNFQGTERGFNWWKATDAGGEYTEGKPYYGYGGSPEGDGGVLKVRGGTARNVNLEGTDDSASIASGTFDSGQELHFEYAVRRTNANGKPPYFFWPSPTMSLCYFPNGADYENDTPITEVFSLWDHSLIYDPDDEGSTPVSNTYTATNGARITVEVKKSVYTELTAAGGVKLNYPTYLAHVKIENMKNSFYIKTQGSGSFQGPHYFRNLDNISVELNNGSPDSYFLEDYQDEKGGNTGTIGKQVLGAAECFWINGQSIIKIYQMESPGQKQKNHFSNLV